jgi:HAD superfamily hydrolase (TIGR01509 family)
MIRAAIFDMDGVIIDSEKIYRRACTELVDELGGKISVELFERQMGLKMSETQKVVVQTAGLEIEPEEFGKRYMERYLELARETLVPNPGLVNLLDFLSEKVELAIASSTEKAAVEELMKRIGVLDYFEIIVGGDEVDESKPSPMIYLKASELLGVNPEECIVIEDSPNGIKSGIGAGMEVLGVRHGENAHLDLSASSHVFDDLYGVKEYLETVLNGNA